MSHKELILSPKVGEKVFNKGQSTHFMTLKILITERIFETNSNMSKPHYEQNFVRRYLYTKGGAVPECLKLMCRRERASYMLVEVKILA
jgi:hypothetical protein